MYDNAESEEMTPRGSFLQKQHVTFFWLQLQFHEPSSISKSLFIKLQNIPISSLFTSGSRQELEQTENMFNDKLTQQISKTNAERLIIKVAG